MSGEVPEGWRCGRISDLVAEVTARIDPQAIADPNTPYLGLEDIGQGTGTVVSVGRAAEATSQKSSFAAGDILFGKLRPNLKKVARPDFDGICSTDISVFRAKSGVDPDFAFWMLFSEPVIEHAVAHSAGTKMPRAHARSILAFDTILPPLDEQRRIAEVLRSVDETIRLSHLAVDQAENALRSAREHLTGLDGSEDGWSRRTILDCFQLQRGHDLPVQHRIEGEVPVIASNGPVGFHNEAPVQAPAVVTGRSGTIGKVTFFDGACWPLNTTLFVRDFKGSNPRYLYHFLSAFPLASYATGTGVPTLNRNDVHAVEVSWPSRDEQDRRVEVLDSLEAAWTSSKDSLVATQSLKSKLSSDLLSGRVRVPA